MATRSEDELRTSDDDWDEKEPSDIDEPLDGDTVDAEAEEGDTVAEVGDDDVDTDDDDDDDDAESSAKEGEDALDELETEELEMLTEDEANETLAVDEAAEMRALRRAELALTFESPSEAAENEFVCQSCFLVKRATQLADKRRKWCTDCAR